MSIYRLMIHRRRYIGDHYLAAIFSGSRCCRWPVDRASDSWRNGLILTLQSCVCIFYHNVFFAKLQIQPEYGGLYIHLVVPC